MPSSFARPNASMRIKNNLSLFLIKLVLLSVVSLFGISHCYADAFNSNQSPALSSAKNNLGGQDDFLPVLEAYKLEPSLTKSADGKHFLRLAWKIAPTYYLYLERFKFKSTPEQTLAPKFSEGKKKFDEFAGKDMTVFQDQVTVDFELASDTAFDLAVTAQGCAEAGLCYPPFTQHVQIDPQQAIALVVTAVPANTPPAAQADNEKLTEEPPLPLWQYLIFAILGGMILNLMPCVFPVLSIKVMSLVQADADHIRQHGWVYTLGIVLCFVGFASILLVARHGGEAIGWGFQLQSTGLVIGLTYLLFVMGLSMSGLVQLGAGLMGVGQSLTEKSGLSGSFFTGVLAAVVASPCTAPFMGAALGFALTQPGFICLSIFAALGFGMALPLLLLCYWPSLSERMPKPGLWMENLKEFLAFPLYLSAIWLLWVLTNQTNTNVMAGVCMGAVAISFGFWLINRPVSGIWRRVNQALALASFLIAILLPNQLLEKSREVSRWQPYSPELLADLRAQGRPVLIDLTADWCITCLANERVTLSKESVIAAFDAHKVATLKGDWTKYDPKITELLSEYGRSGVPLYLWFPANRAGKADVLPQILSPDLIIKTVSDSK